MMNWADSGTTRQGKVYLVGAGPGAIAYLTVRAQELLSQAEVLVYDALIDPALMSLIPADCQTFEVGKRGGKPSTPQADINRLLVEQCLAGKQVVRLKSGDPFIYGRCAEEIQALQQMNCRFEAVPGISSALAAPLLMGIPLTDPVVSRSFAVVTGHDPDSLDWSALARIETLVVLMGTRNLSDIAERLQRHGKLASTPVAVIRWAAHPQQQVWISELGHVAWDTQNIRLSPSVIVIGEVVRLHSMLKSSEPPLMPTPSTQTHPLPLKNCTVLVTRSAGQSSQFNDLLVAQGAKTVDMPALEITPPSSWAELDRAIAEIDTFDWLILTSSNGVNYFFQRLLEQGLDARSLASLRIAVVGKKTAKVLAEKGLQPDFIPPNFVADSMVESFPVEDLKGARLLFPRVETGGRELLVQEFCDRGAEVVEVPAYESGCPHQIDANALQALKSGQVDVITFASSKTVKNFCQLIEATPGLSICNRWFQSVSIASIGPQTSQACTELLGRVDIEAQEYTLDGLTQAIISWVASHQPFSP
ncbi:MAG: uroporphyrinogen-III C-methyltransferase [Thainema sp.]